MKKLKAIFFDLDNTLIIEKRSVRDSFRDTIKVLDSTINRNKFIDTILHEARILWYDIPVIDYCLNIGISSWTALWADFDGEDENLKFLKSISSEYRKVTWNNALLSFGIRDISLAIKLSDNFKRIRNTNHHLFSDTINCLKKLKCNYKLGLLTNGAPDIQWKKINGGQLKPYFESIVISGEYGYGKPDIRIYQEMLKQLQCQAKYAIMIGDSLRTDIAGAKKCGINTVWLNRDNKKNNQPDLVPDFEIKSLNELEEIFNTQ